MNKKSWKPYLSTVPGVKVDSDKPESSKIGQATGKARLLLSRAINFVIKGLLKIAVPVVEKINKNYSMVLKSLYVIRFLFLILIILIIAWSAYSPESTATPLYHLYSILKLISVILIIIAGIFVYVFSVDRESRNKSDNKIEIEIAVLYNFLYQLPYMYDLISIIFLLGILKAYYIRGCGNKTPNVYKFIDIIIYGPFAIITICLIFNILTRILKLDIPSKNKLNIITRPALATSIVTLIIYFIIQKIERSVANNLAYWMNLYDGAPSGVDCQSDDLSDSGLEIAKNIIISIVLGNIVLIILLMQLYPFDPMIELNTKTRYFIHDTIDAATSQFTSLIDHTESNKN